MENKTEAILKEIRKVIVGKDDVVSKVLMAVLARGHVLIEDVPGVGKTTLALAFSRVLGLDYKRIQFTSDSTPSDIIGFSIYNKEKGTFEYKQGAVMTNLLLADEINRTSSKTQSALLEVMEEGQVTLDGETHVVPEPFTVIATQNPSGSSGTQLLPNSQLDRFMVRLHMGYPDFKDQVSILKERHHSNPLDMAVHVADKEDILNMQKEVDDVFISDPIYEYVTSLAEATRLHPMVQLGVSIRGALSLCQAAKAYAYISLRDYVVPEDIGQVFIDVCSHRIILKPNAKISKVTVESVLKEVLSTTKMPILKEQKAL